MLERSILSMHVECPSEADTQAVRERLKGLFPAGAARRMTLLGMMVGSAVKEAGGNEALSLVYSSEFGESLALESYLKSFPSPSPTLFQTSVHPSGFQQGCILRQAPVPEAIPLVGGPGLMLQSALACLTNPAPRLLWCGGEETGTWLRGLGAASQESFAFAIVLGEAGEPGAIGRIRLAEGGATEELSLHEWVLLLRDRRDWQGPVGPGWHLSLLWI